MSILKNKFLYISTAILFFYILPFLIFGENSYILIHDNLDANIVWFKFLATSGMIFSPSSDILSALMDASRGAFGSEYSVLLWINYLFDPYTSYVLSQIFMRSIAFVGMYFLLNRYIFKESNKEYSLLLSLLYSLLPFWHSGGLSIAGLPLITFVFLNIRNDISRKKDWLILLLFPFYSDFILSMMFFIIIVGFIWIYDIYKRNYNIRFTIALFLFGSIYLLINYRLLEVFIFGSEFISHRVERVTTHYGFIDAIRVSLKHFIYGQYHTHSLHLIFLPFIGIIFLMNLFSKNKDKLFIGLFIFNIIISLWYGFWKYEGWEVLKQSSNILNSLNLARFHALTPVIWYVLFALSIKYYIINFSFKYKYYIINSLIVINIVFLFYKSDFVQEYRKSGITYKQFYSESLFQNIDSFIGKDKNLYRVISLGIHPSIALYNKYYVADGYLASYDIDYKHNFREVISKELMKNEKLKKNFDYWGNRCYLFSNDIGYNFVRKKDEVYPIHITLNNNALKKLGVEYIFSSYEIINEKENNIKLLKKFEDNDSAWDIYLYNIQGQL